MHRRFGTFLFLNFSIAHNHGGISSVAFTKLERGSLGGHFDIVEVTVEPFDQSLITEMK